MLFLVVLSRVVVDGVDVVAVVGGIVVAAVVGIDVVRDAEVAATHCDFLAAFIIPTLLTPSSPQSQTSVIEPSTYRKLLRIFL